MTCDGNVGGLDSDGGEALDGRLVGGGGGWLRRRLWLVVDGYAGGVVGGLVPGTPGPVDDRKSPPVAWAEW